MFYTNTEVHSLGQQKEGAKRVGCLEF